MCHLAPFCNNQFKKEGNVMMGKLCNLEKAVDSFHFIGHRDKVCQEKYNPWELKKKLGFESINSPACEQSFTWLNKYRNVKG